MRRHISFLLIAAIIAACLCGCSDAAVSPSSSDAPAFTGNQAGESPLPAATMHPSLPPSDEQSVLDFMGFSCIPACANRICGFYEVYEQNTVEACVLVLLQRGGNLYGDGAIPRIAQHLRLIIILLSGSL